MIVYPNTLKADRSLSNNRNYKFNNLYLENSDNKIAAGYQSRSKSPVLQDDHRSYKIKMDYQSKVSCLPNSLTI